MILQSFDKTKSVNGDIIIPEKYSEIFGLINNPQKHIVKGAGLSYCAASIGNDVNSIDLKYFNRIIDFDDNLGTIEIEAGITIGELSNFLLKNYWIIPSLPGYPSITIGGCVAFNVHGKSQFKTGNFKDWILSLKIFHHTMGLINCSETNNSQFFYNTIGGLGLTGIIISVKLKLKKIEGNVLMVKKIKCKNIKDSINIMIQEEENQDYIYSWNNFNKKKESFGSGIVYLERHTSKRKPIKLIKYQNQLQRFNYPPILQLSWAVKMMTYIYEFSSLLSKEETENSFEQLAFPIYGKEIYYKMFGKKGFREYQVILPYNNWEFAVEEIRDQIEKMNIPISLASLKIFKGEKHNLSFSGNGLCVVIDVPNIKKSELFFEKLDYITLKYKGIINLSKDSRLGNIMAHKIFDDYLNFKEFLFQTDPNKIYQSELRERLCL